MAFDDQSVDFSTPSNDQALDATMNSEEMFMKTFDERTTQDWMDVMTGLSEIWTQNVVEESQRIAPLPLRLFSRGR